MSVTLERADVFWVLNGKAGEPGSFTGTGSVGFRHTFSGNKLVRRVVEGSPFLQPVRPDVGQLRPPAVTMKFLFMGDPERVLPD